MPSILEDGWFNNVIQENKEMKRKTFRESQKYMESNPGRLGENQES